MSQFAKGTVVLSFDDGCKDAYRLFQEILKKYSIPATCNIVTAWINSENKLSCQELEEMSQSPLIEIAAHGHTHQNTDEDIVQSKKLLCEWLHMGEPIGFASPGSDMKKDFVVENAKKLDDMGFLYIRSAGIGKAPTARHLQIREKALARGFDGYVVQNTNELVFEYTSKFVNSVVVYNAQTSQQLMALTDLAIEEKACIVFMFHRIVKAGEPNYDSTWSFDFDKFHEFAMYLYDRKTEGVLDIMTTRDAYRKGLTETYKQ